MSVHMHPCVTCGEPAPCDGDLQRNIDGLPEIICVEYHVTFGKFDHRCEACQAAHERQAEADRLENEPASLDGGCSPAKASPRRLNPEPADSRATAAPIPDTGTP